MFGHFKIGVLTAALLLASATAPAEASGKYKFYPPTYLNCLTGKADTLMGCPEPTPHHDPVDVAGYPAGFPRIYVDKNGYTWTNYGNGTLIAQKDGYTFTYQIENHHAVLTNSQAPFHW